MIYPFLFCSSFLFSYEIVGFFTDRCLDTYSILSLSSVFALFSIAFLSSLLFNFIQISVKMAIVEIIIFLSAGLFLKYRRNEKIRHNYQRAEVFFFIIPFSFLIIRNHFFSSNKYMSLTNESHFMELYSVTNSIALGNNHKFPFYINYDGNTFQNQIIEIEIIASIFIKCGCPQNFAFTFILTIQLIAVFSGLHCFSFMFSSKTNDTFCSYVSIFLFAFIFHEHQENFLLNYSYIMGLPFVIFGYCILLNGVFRMFKTIKEFIFAGILAGATFFTSANMFYASIIIQISIAILTFPYPYLYHWQRVLQKWYFWLLSLIFSFLPQMFWVSCTYERSLLIKRPHRDYLKLLFTKCPLLFITYLFFSWFNLKSNSQVITNFSFLISYVISGFIYTEVARDIEILFGSFLPFACVSVANFISFLVNSDKKKYLNYLGILLVFLMIYPNMFRTAIATKTNKVEYFNETTKALSDWALRNTKPGAVVFNEFRGFDPIVAIAGRQTPEGPTFMIKNSCFDIPHSMRILSYIMNNANQLRALQTYGIQYIIKHKNATNYGFQNLDSFDYFVKVYEYGDFAIYKVVHR